jgi:CRISPR-associated protein Csb1
MSEEPMDLSRFDGWVNDDSEFAALTMRQWLIPVEGKDAVIFPPTYPMDEGKSGYNIDSFSDGLNVCQIDSVGSQANRMEPIFMREKYKHLVPQVIITADDRKINLLQVGHRAADAVALYSPDLEPKLREAFLEYQQKGNAEPLAKIAPTSIVFGCWDSRRTQAKLPRIIRSVIRAYNVHSLTRSAQYSTIAGEILEKGEVQVEAKGAKAELGLAHVPAVKTHGGVIVKGEIRRDAILNLTTLRAIRSSDESKTRLLRRYILGLSLVAITAPQEPNLREGCELVPDPEKPAQWTLVKYDGTREDFFISHEEALTFATAAARAFEVKDLIEARFEKDLAQEIQGLDEKARKIVLREGPITQNRILEAKSQRQTKRNTPTEEPQ